MFERIRAGLLVALTACSAQDEAPPSAPAAAPSFAFVGPELSSAVAPVPPPSSPAPSARPPPGKGGIRHYHASKFPGGVLMAPWSFDSPDGSYDLLIHFHGQPRIVREAAEQAGLDALVAVINLGEGSVRYARPYWRRDVYVELLRQIDVAAAERGVWQPRRKRIALSAWSAGYGAVRRLLGHAEGDDRPDAVLVMDGIHAQYQEDGTLDEAPLEPFVETARAAVRGELLFSITHSDFDPGGYAGSGEVAQFLLHRLDPEPPTTTVGLGDAIFTHLPSAGAVVKAKHQRGLVPASDTRMGSLHVRGFTGIGFSYHHAHFLQMGATVLDELAARWGRRAPTYPPEPEHP